MFLESKYRVYGYLHFADIEQVKLEILAAIKQYRENKTKQNREETKNYIAYFRERSLNLVLNKTI